MGTPTLGEVPTPTPLDAVALENLSHSLDPTNSGHIAAVESSLQKQQPKPMGVSVRPLTGSGSLSLNRGTKKFTSWMKQFRLRQHAAIKAKADLLLLWHKSSHKDWMYCCYL